MPEEARIGVDPPGICPKCGHGMRSGHIKATIDYRTCYWIDDDTTEPAGWFVGRQYKEALEKNGGIILRDKPASRQKVRKTTYYCPVCRWLITDLAEDKGPALLP